MVTLPPVHHAGDQALTHDSAAPNLHQCVNYILVKLLKKMKEKRIIQSHNGRLDKVVIRGHQEICLYRCVPLAVVAVFCTHVCLHTYAHSQTCILQNILVLARPQANCHTGNGFPGTFQILPLSKGEKGLTC